MRGLSHRAFLDVAMLDCPLSDGFKENGGMLLKDAIVHRSIREMLAAAACRQATLGPHRMMQHRWTEPQWTF